MLQVALIHPPLAPPHHSNISRKSTYFEPMLDLTQIAGRGLGLVAAQPIAAGEVVLSEGPLMLYPQHSMSAEVCHHCLRMLGAAGEVHFRR